MRPLCPPSEFPRLLLRVEEAADILGLGRSKVYELLASKQLESISIGRSRRIPTDALERYVARLRETDDN